MCGLTWNIENTGENKTIMLHLLGDLGDRSYYDSNLYTQEVGSNGYVDSNAMNRFKSLIKHHLDLKITYLNRKVKSLRNNISKISVICSHGLFTIL